MANKSLWDFYDGEPFMENPTLAVVGANPKRKKGKKMAARRKARKSNPRRHTHRKAAPRRNPRRRSRRNPILAGPVFNPRRRRGRKNSPKRHRRHHMKRNPALMGVTLPPITMIAWGAGGFIGVPMIETFANKFMPASVTTSVLGRYAVKIGSVLGLTWLVKTVLGQKEAFPVALGGSLNVVVSAINEFAPQLTAPPSTLPATTHAYRSGMVKAYRSGATMNSYGGVLNGAMPNLARSLPGLAQPSKMMSPYSLFTTGIQNPVFSDPRFSAFNTVAR